MSTARVSRPWCALPAGDPPPAPPPRSSLPSHSPSRLRPRPALPRRPCRAGGVWATTPMHSLIPEPGRGGVSWPCGWRWRCSSVRLPALELRAAGAREPVGPVWISGAFPAGNLDASGLTLSPWVQVGAGFEYLSAFNDSAGIDYTGWEVCLGRPGPQHRTSRGAGVLRRRALGPVPHGGALRRAADALGRRRRSLVDRRRSALGFGGHSGSRPSTYRQRKIHVTAQKIGIRIPVLQTM